MPSSSSSSHISTQSPISTSRPSPPESDIITLTRHACAAKASSKTNSTSTPLPAGIMAPVREKPRTVLFPVDVVKPAAAAAPPEALIILAPVTSN